MLLNILVEFLRRSGKKKKERKGGGRKCGKVRRISEVPSRNPRGKKLPRFVIICQKQHTGPSQII